VAEEGGTQGTITLPAATGGANWEGAVLDPETGYLYVSSVTAPSFLSLVPGGDRSDMNYVAGGGRGNLAPGVPIVKAPWGRITAIDLTTGDHAWMVPNGDTPDYVAERLGIDPSLVPNTGKPARANLLVTGTVLFSGEGVDPIFRALDKATGETIAEIELPGATVGNPMTYMHQGRQYVVVTVSEGGQPSEIVALRLPE
jgi:quinoprotein glucose dehydrogenase